MSEEIDYRVYCLLMAPDSQNAMSPKSTTPAITQWNASGKAMWHYPLDNAGHAELLAHPRLVAAAIKADDAADLDR